MPNNITLDEAALKRIGNRREHIVSPPGLWRITDKEMEVLLAQAREALVLETLLATLARALETIRVHDGDRWVYDELGLVLRRQETPQEIALFALRAVGALEREERE